MLKRGLKWFYCEPKPKPEMVRLPDGEYSIRMEARDGVMMLRMRHPLLNGEVWAPVDLPNACVVKDPQ